MFLYLPVLNLICRKFLEVVLASTLAVMSQFRETVFDKIMELLLDEVRILMQYASLILTLRTKCNRPSYYLVLVFLKIVWSIILIIVNLKIPIVMKNRRLAENELINLS